MRGRKKKIMQISIRKFNENDIHNKIKWINDAKNNRFLHYDLPLVYEKTILWFNNNKDRQDRYDAVIEVDNIPVGLIGLLSIDSKNKKAEFYITLGEEMYCGKGVAKKASNLLLEYAFNILQLNKVYLYTEIENIGAQKLFEKVGFKKEGTLKEDLIYNERKVDRYFYGITKQEYTNHSNYDSTNIYSVK